MLSAFELYPRWVPLKVEFKKFAVTLGEATSYIYLSNSEIKLEY